MTNKPEVITQRYQKHGGHLELPKDYDPSRPWLQLDTDTGYLYVLVVTKDGDVVRSPIDGKWQDAVRRFRWWAHKNLRGEYDSLFCLIRMRDGKVRPLGLHRLIYLLENEGFPESRLVVDHQDRDPLNNREANLRALPRLLNLHNSDHFRERDSRFPGVYRNEKTAKWEAKVTIDGNEIEAGEFPCEEDAANEVLATLMEQLPDADWTEEVIEEFFPGVQGRTPCR